MLLGIIDITPQIESFDENLIDEFAHYKDAKVDITIYDRNWPELYGVCLISGEKIACVASLNAYENGPHWELPLQYLEHIINNEFKYLYDEYHIEGFINKLDDPKHQALTRTEKMLYNYSGKGDWHHVREVYEEV